MSPRPVSATKAPQTRTCAATSSLSLRERVAECGRREEEARAARQPVLRPKVLGKRRAIPEPPMKKAMDDVREVMEGVSIADVTKGKPQEVRANLANLITRCQRVMALLPGEQKATKKQGGKGLPTISRIEVVEGEMKVKGKEAFKKVLKQKAQPSKGKEVPTAGNKQDTVPGTSWAEVVKKGRGKKPTPTPPPKDASKEKARRAPRSAAVALAFPEGEAGEGMRFIRSQIKLKELGIDNIKPRKALTGAMLLEIPGGEEAKGHQSDAPCQNGRVETRDLDDSVSQEEIQAAIAKAGECPPEEVKVGRIRINPSGLGSTWIQCRLEVARKVAATKKVKIGWVAARIELLEARPLTCCRCLERGHVRQQCKSTVDRSMLCYRCGQEGHKAQTCTATPRCAVCSAKGLPANHKAGGTACRPPSKRERKRTAKLAREQSKGPATTEVPMEVQEAAEPIQMANLNHARQAQDLFLHSLAERGCGLRIVAEPYRIPTHPCWVGSRDGSAAITWRRTGERSAPGSKIKVGENWVAVEWGPLKVIGVYLRPSLSRAEFEDSLHDLEDVVREFLPGPVLVANAKSAFWGSRRLDAVLRLGLGWHGNRTTAHARGWGLQ
ncbi:PREDICTED: uncharacterized protein LOC105557619 [Vollenhovia emeryi]|uniref:uncharacterized protein LOC105557619 n=1 Tax=Vollenhovia emeryi TaxID=411798 RepID=UPI0005F4D688|nr:PREDICTED: uncharacterized protein LOC105557619 [Vollenhovia emeryi]